MKVKIIKAEFKSYWYAGLIGEVFEVSEKYKGATNFVLKEDYEHEKRDKIPWRFIQKTDCEIVATE